MKLEVGEFYLNAAGDIVKIDSYIKGVYPFKTKNNYSYKANGRYNDNETELDLIAHIPKELHYDIIKRINTYYAYSGIRDAINTNYKHIKDKSFQ